MKKRKKERKKERKKRAKINREGGKTVVSHAFVCCFSV